MPKRIALILACELKNGGARGFAAGDVPGAPPFFLVRSLDGDLRAFIDDCPHENVSLALRQDLYLNKKRTSIVCYAHGAQFEIGSGVGMTGPACGLSLSALAVEIDTEGMIQLLLD